MQSGFEKKFLQPSKDNSNLPGGGAKILDKKSTESGGVVVLESVIATIILIMTIVGAGVVYGADFFLKDKIISTEGSVDDALSKFHLDDLKTQRTLTQQIGVFRDITEIRSNYAQILDQATAVVAPGTFFSSLKITLTNSELDTPAYQVAIAATSEGFDAYLEQVKVLRQKQENTKGINLIVDGEVTSFRVGQDEESNPIVLFNYVTTIPLSALQRDSDKESYNSL